ncbi:hypothetical protein M422DRAFT_217189 [Sphaerobolus stellatus SS14]|uniref:YDG domain-containing protein n=1 Tax=Sphaerobolus stellatus (strain SS14) TaxID=990650 RepID=A0A0C9TR58_SPHS4|nr:hypothetical protein M422DRAFT_217189 [Sphaerobolus stellatus SS14]
MPIDFAALRKKQMAENAARLKKLDLDHPIVPPRPKPTPKVASKPSRKRKDSNSSGELEARPAKMAKNASTVTEIDASVASEEGPRRSRRTSGRASLNYNESNLTRMSPRLTKTMRPQLASKKLLGQGGSGLMLNKRVHDPKTFGAIPGIEVGTWWESRQQCSIDAVHAPWVAGISGSRTKGANSVVLSGGGEYHDDLDMGYTFTYTGAGGRDLKGTANKPKNLRTAAQSSDQSFENACNAALLKSVKTQLPVRVVRGYKLESRYAPETGYRYDGLYLVKEAWMATGMNPHGYKVCKFSFQRIDGQPDLPEREDYESEEERSVTPEIEEISD